MKAISIACIGSIVGALSAYAAQALNVSNFDPYPHTITVTVGGDRKQLTIAPHQNVDVACDKGCVVQVESGEQYELKGTHSLTFKDGVFLDTVPGEQGLIR